MISELQSLAVHRRPMRCKLGDPTLSTGKANATNISGCEPMLRRGDFKRQFSHSVRAFRGSAPRPDTFRRS